MLFSDDFDFISGFDHIAHSGPTRENVKSNNFGNRSNSGFWIVDAEPTKFFEANVFPIQMRIFFLSKNEICF